ncbi:MAG: hypothetical protein H6732_18855 [Alphaproteobacteria bacterium]|nr:hypothetical protein [Alphaproteobacteria bacterium]
MTRAPAALALAVLLPATAAGAEESAPSADVVARRVVSRTPEEVTAAFADLTYAAGLFDGDCLRGWSLGVPAAGLGATARVTYVPGPLRRRLLLQVADVVSGRRVDWEHAGPKGFTTRVAARAVEGGTEVTLTTYLSEPPWFVRHAFHEAVHPAWTACYDAALARLDGPAVP